MNDLNAFTGLVRRCVEDYDMIAPGDTVAVGVSGGKDSLVLLLALNELRRYHPKPFSLEAITVELGFEGMDFTPVAELCTSLGVPYTRLKTDIKEVVFDVRKEDNPCSLCAKMRRGALCTALSERGITKLALGHHFDDAVETFLLSLVYEGRISCFQPVTHMTRTGVDQIRPMLYAGEGRITNLAKALALPIVENPCPEDRGSKRYEIKQLIRTMSLTYPICAAKCSVRSSVRRSTAGKRHGKLARVKQDKPGGDSPPGLCVEMKSQRTFWQKRMMIAAVCARVASPFGSRVVTPLALPTPQIKPCATAQDIGVRA